MARSREGFQWTANTGLESGLPCIGVIETPQKIDFAQEVFDVVVIGAGYAGLTAARDTATAGLLFLFNNQHIYAFSLTV